MLVLLPPSQGKRAPTTGAPLDLDRLALPALAPTRRRVLDAVVELCRTDPDRAREVLGVPARALQELDRGAELFDAPAAPVREVYTGVLFEALDAATLPAAALAWLDRHVLVASGAFGLLAPADRVPAYRLAGDVDLPGVGRVAAAWREALTRELPRVAGDRLVLDLRSGVYAGMWLPSSQASAARFVTGRVVRRQAGAGGSRLVAVSHHNKAAKGRLVRDLALALGGGSSGGPSAVAPAAPADPGELAAVLRGLGWEVHLGEAARPRGSWRLDVVQPG